MVKKSKNWIPLATLMLLGGMVWTFAFGRLLYTGTTDVLAGINITGSYYPNIAIVVGIGILLIVGGKKVKEFIK